MCYYVCLYFFKCVLLLLGGGKKPTLCLPLRRLGVELGKVQVYQEANRGKVVPGRA